MHVTHDVRITLPGSPRNPAANPRGANGTEFPQAVRRQWARLFWPLLLILVWHPAMIFQATAGSGPSAPPKAAVARQQPPKKAVSSGPKATAQPRTPSRTPSASPSSGGRSGTASRGAVPQRAGQVSNHKPAARAASPLPSGAFIVDRCEAGHAVLVSQTSRPAVVVLPNRSLPVPCAEGAALLLKLHAGWGTNRLSNGGKRSRAEVRQLSPSQLRLKLGSEGTRVPRGLLPSSTRVGARLLLVVKEDKAPSLQPAIALRTSLSSAPLASEVLDLSLEEPAPPAVASDSSSPATSCSTGTPLDSLARETSNTALLP